MSGELILNLFGKEMRLMPEEYKIESPLYLYTLKLSTVHFPGYNFHLHYNNDNDMFDIFPNDKIKRQDLNNYLEKKIKKKFKELKQHLDATAEQINLLEQLGNLKEQVMIEEIIE